MAAALAVSSSSSLSSSSSPPTSTSQVDVSSVGQSNDKLTSSFLPFVNKSVEKLSGLHLRSLQYLKNVLHKDKHNPPGFLRMYGMLPDDAHELVDVSHGRQLDWFERAARRTTSPALKKVQEGIYNMYVFHFHGSAMDDMIRHTGVKFERRDKDPSDPNHHFIFDVQTWNAKMQFVPMFRVEPKDFKERATLQFVGVVYLLKDLIKLLADMPAHTYTPLGNNCRDGVMSTVTLCQFWNSCLGIPQYIQVTTTLKFMDEIFEKDKEILNEMGISNVTKFNLARRQQTESILKKLAEALNAENYDESMQMMVQAGIIKEQKKQHSCALM